MVGRKKKSAAAIRQEIANLLASFGDGGEQRVRNALREYKLLLKQQRRKAKPLTAEQKELLEKGALKDDYILGCKLQNLEKNL